MAQLAVSQSRQPSDKRLRQAVCGLHPRAPLVIMLHGLKYDPRCPARDPGRHIFALHPDKENPRAASWPRRLGLRGPGGLAVGFCWHACGTIWQACAKADQAAGPLAQLINRLQRIAPDHPVHLVAHSLGARVALGALMRLQDTAPKRIILITPAIFEHQLRAALDAPAAPAAQTEIFNIRSRANWPFDLMLRAAFPHLGATAGRGRLQHTRLFDIDIDDRPTQEAMTAAGFALGAAPARVCHWSGYLRSDVCAFYRKLLHHPDQTPLGYLRAAVAGASGDCAAEAHLSF